MVTVTNMILTQILLAYHISRTAPAQARRWAPRPRDRHQRPERAVAQARPCLWQPLDAVFVWNKGIHAKIRKNSLCFVFLNYSKNKTSR